MICAWACSYRAWTGALKPLKVFQTASGPYMPSLAYYRPACSHVSHCPQAVRLPLFRSSVTSYNETRHLHLPKALSLVQTRA